MFNRLIKYSNATSKRRSAEKSFAFLMVLTLATGLVLSTGVTSASTNQAAAIQAITPPAGAISTGDGTWYWQNNRPQGNPVNALSCPAANTCFAAGNAGTLLKTTDGGTTWTSQNPNTADNLQGISCFDQNNCMAVGDNSTIAVTSNGGTSWNRRFFNGLNQALHGVSCPAANTCFVAGATALLATTNRGASWNVSVQTNDFYAIDCPTTSLCFTAGNIGIIKTTANGGTSWTAQTTSNNTTAALRGIDCIDSNTCFAVGDSGALFKKTSLASSVWTAITGTGNASSLHGISCVDASNCTAVGGGSSNQIFTTSDAGVNWQAQETYAPYMRAVVCKSLTNCYVGGDNGTLLTRKTALATWTPNIQTSSTNYTDVSCPTTSICDAVAGLSFYSSSNGGQSWTKGTTFTSRSDILNLSCTAVNVCAAVGYDGYIYYKNGTDTWLEGTRLPSGTNLYGVECKANGGQPTCYAVAAAGVPDRIFKSVDGGKNYSAVYSPTGGSATDVTLNAISCPSLNNCYAVGANGIILKTDNNTWKSQNNSAGINLSGISCPADNTCFATGENVGLILGTTDSGETWTLLNSPANAVASDLNDISCPSLTVCQAVGNGGTLVTTIDGGNNWITLFRKPSGTVITTNLNAISCPSTSVCAGVGASLTSFTSSDANLGWSGQPLGPRWNLTGAACPSATSCFAGGGDVALYTKNATSWTAISAPILVDISCPNTSECYAPVGGSTDVFYTKNGGTSWTREDMGNIGLNTISCPASNVCFGASTSGDVLGYNGSSWVVQPKVANFGLNGISCPSSTVCFAVGFNTNFIRLSGGTWSSLPLGGSYPLTNISCPDVNTCFASTNNGAVLVTKNGGTNWTLKQTGFAEALYDISCPTSTDCVTTGTRGTILTSRNGGDSWITNASGTSNPLRAVNCNSISVCVTVGDNGTLLFGSIVHSLNITSSSDSGQGTTFGTLSFALKYARPGQDISFNTAVQISGVTASNGLPQVPYGTSLTGSCSATPKYTIIGGIGVASLELSGKNTITGLNFSQLGLKTTGTGNKLSCTGVKIPA